MQAGSRSLPLIVLTYFIYTVVYAPHVLAAMPPLKVTFGPHGLQTISYQGIVLEDQARYPEDAFHVWQIKMTDLKGKPLTAGQNGWGENSVGKAWDSVSHAWTYAFDWGAIRVEYVTGSEALGIRVTEINKAGSGVILDGVSIYPVGVHFAQLPKGFVNRTYPQLSDGISKPGVVTADDGSRTVAVVSENITEPIYSGFAPTNVANTYDVLISSASPAELATFQPHHDLPVKPGETEQFMVSLRFAPSGTTPALIAANAYAAWAKAWPSSLHWKDRRAIGTAYLASSPSGDARQPHGYANNPRRYFNDDRAGDFDVKTSDGLRKFQARLLDQASTIVANARKLDAQGIITWDIEGEEYPQETSYVCSPDQTALLSPEMESIVSVAKSNYRGMKLDDAYFKIIREGGLRVGVCVRPQHFVRAPDGTAQQEFLAPELIGQELMRKIKYAHDRWGATLFYVDSTVEKNGAVVDADIFKKAAAAFPDCLLIPEESNARYYAYTAPFRDFLFHGITGTDAGVRAAYPGAFSAILINDIDAKKLASATSELTSAVGRGDVLMVHADYWHINNTTVQNIYAAAHRKP